MYMKKCDGLVAQSCLTLCNPRTVAHQATLSMKFSRQEYWSGLPFPALLQGIFPTQGLSPPLLHSQADSLPLRRQGSLVRTRQLSPVAQSGPTLCDPMNRSTPGLPVHHQLPEFTQTHVHRMGDAIQPSYPLLSPSPPAPNLSQRQGLFQ